MLFLMPMDWSALAVFALCWSGYAYLMDSDRFAKASLNARMHRYRHLWMEEMLRRDIRIIDTQIMASLQNGTAFFASTSLIAIGGALALLRAADDVLRVFSDLPLGIEASRGLWEAKVIGLAVIFVYAFFKFSWSYRLFNYAAILMGGTPPADRADTPEARAHIRRTASMATAAGRHFNRGQRAFFFALGYLGWFISPWLFIASTAAVMLVMSLRQFRSDALTAATTGRDPPG